MVKRKIVYIDEKKCTGCGVCIPGCAEGALQMIDEKARLISDLFCDGLGACIGDCPEGAITVMEREAEPYDEERVMKDNIIPAGKNTIRAHIRHLRDHGATELVGEAVSVLMKEGIGISSIADILHENAPCASGGCPGSEQKTIHHENADAENSTEHDIPIKNRLSTWPVQLHLLNPAAPFLKNADLMIIADCVAFAYAATHEEFIKDHAVAVGCPKLDDAEAYVDKISDIISTASPASITVVRMNVPCCGGLTDIVKQAITRAGIVMPFEVKIISTDGKRL